MTKHHQADSLEPEPYALQTLQLRKSFAGFNAVDGVDLHVKKEHVHALLGPNGAGKTTLFNLLTGIHKPSGGRIIIGGTPATGLPPDKIGKLGVGRSFQITRLFNEFTCRQHLQLALMAHTSLGGNPLATPRRLCRFDDRCDELLLQVGLSDQADAPAESLPYGRKRALEVAIAIAGDPHLLLLDEPTSGMSLADVDRTVELIRSASIGRTVVLVEHNMKVVANLADHVTVLQAGAILAQGSYDEVRQDSRVIEAYLGRKRNA
jgi:branched-chain amino acid transport system ATP-binding protein